MSDRTLPVVIYGHAPVPDWKWHKDKHVSTNTEYSGDLCRADRKAELRKRWLSLEPNFPKPLEELAGHDRARIAPCETRTVTERPFQVPKTATIIYCVKTGQPVGTMDYRPEFFPSAVHKDWTATNGPNLDRIQEHNPREYVAFCLGLIDNFWRSTCHRSKVRENAVEHYWSLVRAYDLLGQVSDDHLVELAQALCRFCTYAPLSYRVLDHSQRGTKRAADDMATLAVHGALLGLLDKSTVRTLAHADNYARCGASVKMPKFEILPSSIEDAAKGPSNIRDQKGSKEYHKNARANKLLADITKLAHAAGFFGADEKPQAKPSALLARLSRNSDKLDTNIIRQNMGEETQEDMLAELQSLMLGGSDIYDADDEEDNRVEMRTIPRELVPSYSAPRATPATMTISEKRLTLAERIARDAQLRG